MHPSKLAQHKLLRDITDLGFWSAVLVFTSSNAFCRLLPEDQILGGSLTQPSDVGFNLALVFTGNMLRLWLGFVCAKDGGN